MQALLVGPLKLPCERQLLHSVDSGPRMRTPPGYGQTGPYRKAAGYDVIVEAEAGLMHM